MTDGPPRLGDETENGQETPKREHPAAGILRFFKELPVLIAVALLVALLIKSFVVQAFFIEQRSMEPTLHPGNRVLVSKFSYRLGGPERGDVVVFRDPRDPCDEPDPPPECQRSLGRRAFDWFAEAFGLPSSRAHLVKRIVGLPGETVAIHQGGVYACDSPCEPLTDDGEPQDGTRVDFETSDESGPRTDDDEMPATSVPSDRYFVMGDNRAESSDSRSFGAISETKIVGKILVVIWPPGDAGGI